MAPAAAAAKPNPLSDRYAVDLGRTEYYQQTPAALDLASGAGIGWARVLLAYKDVEPSAGRYEWTASDALVAQLVERRIRILGRITPAVAWNTTAPPSAVGHFQDYPPADYGGYAQYVTELVSRYKGSIHSWEIGNEMDTNTFWHSTPAEYAHLLAVSHDAVKAADPHAKVVLGGVVSRQAPAWLSAILNDPVHPAGRNFDVAAFHSYQDIDSLARSYADAIVAELAQDGVGDKPLWVTETGASVNPSEQPDPKYQGPVGQAAWLRARMRLLSEAGADKVFWFKLMDLVESDERNELGLTHSALLDYGLNPRFAYTAYEDVIAREARAEIGDRVRYRRGGLRLRLACPLDATYDRCRGTLSVHAVHANSKRRLPILARRHYTVKPGARRSLRARVPSRRRRLLRGGLRIEAKARADPCPTTRCVTRLELRVPG